MTALSIAYGYHARTLAVFLFLAIPLALAARPVFRGVLTEPPGEDVLGPCEQYAQQRRALGERCEHR